MNQGSSFGPRAIAAAVCLSLLASFGQAGGPLVNFGGDGRIFRWDVSQPVQYRIDPGAPGGGLSAEEGANIIREAFGRWDNIPTSALETRDDGFLAADIDATNVLPLLNQQQPANSIIFDADGSIINLLTGGGGAGVILGITTTLFVSEAENRYLYGVIILNSSSSGPGFSQTVTHEVGHLLGLDHSQVNRQFAFPGNPNVGLVPLMYPFSINGQVNSPGSDERAWISWLYPRASFESDLGSIRGVVRRNGGHPLSGAEVVALPLNPDLSEDPSRAVSVVSDFEVRADGSYVLPGLTPGDYHLFVGPIGNPAFVGGSGVGPFDVRPVDFPVRDYYNGPREAGSDAIDDPGERIAIRVVAGETVEGIDFVTNNVAQDDPINREIIVFDDDARRVEFPASFAFPFAGRAFTSAMMHDDGNLTFLFPDTSSAARTIGRFDSFPRIAPFFSDMNPIAGGELRVVSSPGQLRFEWNALPEFVPPGGPPPGTNTFSATLFSTGDILFEYQEINATADPLQVTQNGAPVDAGDLTAIVGISPGVFGESLSGLPETLFGFEQSTDLTAPPFGGFQLGERAIFETFGERFPAIAPGAAANLPVDLQFSSVRFNAPTFPLYFPFSRNDDLFFTGFAATDFADANAVITATSRNTQGMLSTEDGLHVELLESGRQFALGSADLFGGVPAGQRRDEWVLFDSSQSAVASFFQFGNGLSGTALTQLDGGVAWEQLASTLVFSRVFQGPVFPSFSGPLQAETIFSIANPSQAAIQLEFTYFQPTGAQALPVVNRIIPAQGFLRESFSSLFSSSDPLMDGHVVARVTTGPGAVGFQLVQLPDSVFGLNAFQASSSDTIYSAQLASGIGSFTDLKVVNTSDQLRLITISAIDEDGDSIGTPFQLPLTPNQSLQREAGELFGLQPGGNGLLVGSLIVQADGPGVVGDVIFGDPESVETAAALQLQSELFRSAIFSQVANGATNPDDSSTNIFTGVAVFNPGDTPAQVTIRVFDNKGSTVGQTVLDLGAGARTSQLIDELIQLQGPIFGGYIRLDSTQPIVAQQLFGNSIMTFLSAVPPKMIE